jgi:CBS domain-containing protein
VARTVLADQMNHLNRRKPMSLREILRRDLIHCGPSQPIENVAQLMRDNDVGAVVVVKDGKPVGIVTDRDITLRCVADKVERVSPVEAIMTKQVETVSIDEGIFEVIRVMKRNEVRRVPVVDDTGKAVGLVSFGDVYQLVGQELSDLLAPVSPKQPKIDKHAA